MKAFDIFDEYATDPKLELDGKWEIIGPVPLKADGKTLDTDKAPAILVARSGNRRNQRMTNASYEANKTILDAKDEASAIKDEELTIDVMAKSILLGWRNMPYKGKLLPDGWDVTTAKELLSMGNFRARVHKISADEERYKIANQEADAKNS